MHDASKVLLGATGSSSKESSRFDSDPADTPAGVAVSLDSDGLLSTAVADGKRVGISLGKDLQNVDKTVVARVGLRVPILLTNAAASLTVNGDLVFTAVTPGADGNSITITLTDSATAGEEVCTVDGTDIDITMDDTVSTATQIKAAFDANAEAVALATCTIVEGQGGAGQADLAEDALEGGYSGADYVVVGEKVYIDDVTGYANDSEETVTISDAVYVSGVLTGITEAGAEVEVALVDMPGGL
jgi:hypothetical protein